MLVLNIVLIVVMLFLIFLLVGAVGNETQQQEQIRKLLKTIDGLEQRVLHATTKIARLDTAYHHAISDQVVQREAVKEKVKRFVTELNYGKPVQLNWDPDPSDLSLDTLKALD